MKSIIQGKHERLRVKLEQNYNNGFNWAWESLLRGKSPEEIEVQIDNPFSNSEYDKKFDRGVADALFKWCREKGIELP